MNLIFETDNIGVVINKLKTLKEGKYTLSIKKHRQLRSLQQNKYYHGVVVRVIALEIGDLDEAIHEMLKLMFLPKYAETKTGKKITYAGSTKELDTKEFSVYIEQIRKWAMMEMNIHIPGANDVTEEMLLELSEQYERFSLS